MAEMSRRTLQSLVGADLLVGRAGEGSGLLLGGGRLGSLTCLENKGESAIIRRSPLAGRGQQNAYGGQTRW